MAPPVPTWNFNFHQLFISPTVRNFPSSVWIWKVFTVNNFTSILCVFTWFSNRGHKSFKNSMRFFCRFRIIGRRISYSLQNGRRSAQLPAASFGRREGGMDGKWLWFAPSRDRPMDRQNSRNYGRMDCWYWVGQCHAGGGHWRDVAKASAIFLRTKTRLARSDRQNNETVGFVENET